MKQKADWPRIEQLLSGANESKRQLIQILDQLEEAGAPQRLRESLHRILFRLEGWQNRRWHDG